ncbi:MAG: chemotaxis protein CheC [Pseudoalteromonas tetraodonis]|jgi:chemotaxis protein CheC
MAAHDEKLLTEHQLDIFGKALHCGATNASEALGRWIGKPTSISVDLVEQFPLAKATGVLGLGDEPICFCIVEMEGRLTGHLVLAFNDSNGLALADLLLDLPRGTAVAWGEMETSAALETTNILSCHYLDSLARALPAGGDPTSQMLPSPPRFNRDFPESLIEFIVMDQIITADYVLLARVGFRIDGDPVDWTMLLVPDAASMVTLRELLK